MSFCDFYLENEEDDGENIVYEIDLNNLTGDQLNSILEVHKRYLMTKTDPGRIKRARQDIKTNRRQVRVNFDDDGNQIVMYDFRANPSREFRNHWGYIKHQGDDVNEVFCDCKDFFYRLYAPMVKNGLATWDIPAKYKKRLNKFVGTHNREWTKETNPSGKLYVCKHLYALLLEFVGKGIDARPLKGKRISPELRKELIAKLKAKKAAGKVKSDVSVSGDKRIGDKHIGPDDANKQDKIASDIEALKAKEKEAEEAEVDDNDAEEKEADKNKKKNGKIKESLNYIESRLKNL